MKFEKNELLFIHDKAKGTLPYLKALVSDGQENEFAEEQIKVIESVRVKCRIALINDHNTSGEFLDAHR